MMKCTGNSSLPNYSHAAQSNWIRSTECQVRMDKVEEYAQLCFFLHILSFNLLSVYLIDCKRLKCAGVGLRIHRLTSIHHAPKLIASRRSR